ncbi:MAG: heme-copper oxidase subunit III [Candidatus Wallbacteria bacterium]|nr:heme-copper oxidase subunit III [Candidatus Wallbacteria bacterium]
MNAEAVMDLESTEPVAGSHELTPGKVGMWVFLVTDALSFGGLLIGYASLRAWSPVWPVPSTVLDIPLTAFNTFLLICSSVSMVLAVASAEAQDRKGVIRYLAATIACGAGFLGIQAYEYHHLFSTGLSLSSSLFGATFFTLTGFHGAHVTSGVLYLSGLLAGVLAGKFVGPHESHIEIAGLFWHFVDLIWILIFTFVYLV